MSGSALVGRHLALRQVALAVQQAAATEAHGLLPIHGSCRVRAPLGDGAGDVLGLSLRPGFLAAKADASTAEMGTKHVANS